MHFAPQYPRARRHLGGGGLGGHKLKSLGSCQTAAPIGAKFGTCLRIRLGMDCWRVHVSQQIMHVS